MLYCNSAHALASSSRQITIPDTQTGYYGGTPDALSHVRKFGVIAPSTNTIVEYDFWKMLIKNDVEGVGLHQARDLTSPQRGRSPACARAVPPVRTPTAAARVRLHDSPAASARVPWATHRTNHAAPPNASRNAILTPTPDPNLHRNPFLPPNRFRTHPRCGGRGTS